MESYHGGVTMRVSILQCSDLDDLGYIGTPHIYTYIIYIYVCLEIKNMNMFLGQKTPSF
jgi:hypothetical protein